MMYGKIIDGELKLHGVDLPIYNQDGSITITGDPELLLKNGFKEVVYIIPEPRDGYNTNGFVWTETGTQLIQTWNYIECDEPVYEPSLEERLDTLELAMLEMLGVNL